VLEGLFSSWEEERRVHRLVSKAFFLFPAAPSKADISPHHLQLSSIKATSSIRSPPPPTSSLPSLSSTLSSTHLPSLPTAASSLLNTYNASRRAGPQSSSTNAPTPAVAPEEDNGPDLKEVDKLLGELTGMAGRWSLYRRFLWARLQVSCLSSLSSSPEGAYANTLPSGRHRRSESTRIAHVDTE
jgi:hypothetical protein